MHNPWGNPTTAPEHMEVVVTCVHCGKELRFGDTRADCHPPLFVCLPCSESFDGGGACWRNEIKRLHSTDRKPAIASKDWETAARAKLDVNLRGVFT